MMVNLHLQPLIFLHFLEMCCGAAASLSTVLSSPQMLDFPSTTRPTSMDLKSKSSSSRQLELLNSFDITCNDLSRLAIDRVVTSCTLAKKKKKKKRSSSSSRESDHAAVIHSR